jgi:hypothetical protein
VAIRAIETQDEPAFQRVLVDLADCVRCTKEERNRARVVAWTADHAIVVRIDALLAMATIRHVDLASVAWPSIEATDPPRVHRPNIQGAPSWVATRDPLPHCGHRGDRPADLCFTAAVLSGRPAEVLDHGYPTEGGARITFVYRFTGIGTVSEITHSEGSDDWTERGGFHLLATDRVVWGFSSIPVYVP